MPIKNILTYAKIHDSWAEANEGAGGAQASATHAAVVNAQHVITVLEASYSDRTITGLVSITLTTPAGAITIKKHCHGYCAIDFSRDGLVCNPNTAIVATLAAGGGAVVAEIAILGFSLNQLPS